MAKPITLLTGDWHISLRNPICRKDNLCEVQWGKINFIKQTALKYQVPIICPGDIYDGWNSNSELVNKCIEQMPFIYTIIGNHDQPSHNIDLMHKSVCQTLSLANKLEIVNKYKSFDGFDLYGLHYGETGEIVIRNKNKPNLILLHQDIWYKEKIHPKQTDLSNVEYFIKKYPGFLICAGHIHDNFTYKNVICPGSISRRTAKQINHKPSIYLIYDDLTYEKIEIPIKEDVFDLEHIRDLNTKRDNVDKIKETLERQATAGNYEAMECEELVEQYIERNRIRYRTKQILLDLIERVKNDRQGI